MKTSGRMILSTLSVSSVIIGLTFCSCFGSSFEIKLFPFIRKSDNLLSSLCFFGMWAMTGSLFNRIHNRCWWRKILWQEACKQKKIAVFSKTSSFVECYGINLLISTTIIWTPFGLFLLPFNISFISFLLFVLLAKYNVQMIPTKWYQELLFMLIHSINPDPKENT